MCERCHDPEDAALNRWFDTTIERYGWAITGVEADDETVPWLYTMGLADGFDHPELIVVGMRYEAAKRLLNELGDRIRNGLRITTSSVPEVGDHLFTVGPVDPEQFDLETFAIWWDYYERHRRTFVPRAALQLFPPACLVSYGGDPRRWRLDTPHDVVGRLEPRWPPP